MQPEARLSRKIIRALRQETGSKGWWVKIHGSAAQASGLPDIIGCYRGVFVGLEVKMPGREDTLSLKQSVNLQRIEHSGGVPRLVTTPEAALEVILEIRKRLDSDS